MGKSTSIWAEILGLRQGLISEGLMGCPPSSAVPFRPDTAKRKQVGMRKTGSFECETYHEGDRARRLTCLCP